MSANAVALVRPPDPVPVDDWNQARVDFVLKTYCGGADEATASAFVHIARKRRLSPEEKQIYLINRGGKWSVETSIDGFRLIADRSDRYAGSDEAVYGEETAGHPATASVTVWKLVQGIRCPFTATARWAEYCPKAATQAFMWNDKPYLMLGKCAEALALRKAFPADLSGIYVDAEMAQAGNGDPSTAELARARGAGQPTPHRGLSSAVRATEARSLAKDVGAAFAVGVEEARTIGQELLRNRWGVGETADLSAEQIGAVRDAVLRWRRNPADLRRWLALFEGEATPDMLADVEIVLSEAEVEDELVWGALALRKERLGIEAGVEGE